MRPPPGDATSPRRQQAAYGSTVNREPCHVANHKDAVHPWALHNRSFAPPSRAWKRIESETGYMRPVRAGWLPKRRGMATGAVAAALLLALALLRRDAGPTWVASAVPTQVALACWVLISTFWSVGSSAPQSHSACIEALFAHSQADVLAGSVQSALSNGSPADDAAAAAGNVVDTVDRREALQQSASEGSTGSDSGVHPRTSAKDADGGGRGSSSSSGSSHTRSSKASKAAGKAPGSTSAAAAGVHSPAASAQPDQRSGDPLAANPAADAVDGAAEDAPDSESRGAGTGDDAASRAGAAGAAADADQAAKQPSEADGGASDGVVSDDAPQQGDSEDNVQLQANSTSAAADPSVQQGSESEASGFVAAADGGQSAEVAEPAEQSADPGAQPLPAPQRARKTPRRQPQQPATQRDAATAKAAPKAGKGKDKGKGKGKGKGKSQSRRPRPAHDSFGPIQAELLAAVEAAINPDGAVMLAVSRRPKCQSHPCVVCICRPDLIRRPNWSISLCGSADSKAARILDDLLQWRLQMLPPPCLLRSRPANAAQVTNKEGALFQLPQLLSSMRLVPQEDISRHLVVVTYSAPAQVCTLHRRRRDGENANPFHVSQYVSLAAAAAVSADASCSAPGAGQPCVCSCVWPALTQTRLGLVMSVGALCAAHSARSCASSN
jgi:hypothetical protein